MFFLIAFLLFVRLPSITQNSKSIKDGYEVLSLEPVSGKYADSQYVNAHRIPTSAFTATSTGDRDGNPVSNAFDDNSKSFWVSRDPETSSFHPSIFVDFKEPVSFDALLFDPVYRTSDPDRYYDGFPHKLKIYTALNDGPLELTAIFTGNPANPMTQIQFVMHQPIKCTRLQLEFCEISEATYFETTDALAATEGIKLLQVFDHDVVYYEKTNGRYDNSNFIKFHKIPSSSFTPTSTGDRGEDVVSNAFDNNNDKSWVSSEVETDTFHPSIFIDFKKQTLVDGFTFIVKSHKKNNNRYLDGFPTSLYVYTASNDEQYKLHTVFIGTPSTDALNVQYVFTKPVECTKIQLEFHDVSLFNQDTKLAAVDEISIFQNFNADTVYYGSITGNYANSNYANFHQIDPSKITASSNSNDDAFPASNAFDNAQSTSWISKDVETETFHPSLFAQFDEPVLLEAFTFGVKSHKKVTTRYFDGFPALIALYTSLNDEPMKLNTVFIGNVDTGILFYLYTLSKPVNCTKVQIEFHDVTQFDSDGKKGQYASTDGITFYVNKNEDTLNCVKVNGDYANPNYVEYHKIPTSKFTAIANSNRDTNPIENAFDGNTGTYWIANEVQSDTFNPTITVDFKEPVLLEAFLYDFKKSKKVTSWYLDGYPSQIIVYTQLNDEPMKLNSAFLGSPSTSDSRTQYVFSSPVKCTKVQLVLYDISEFERGSRLACISELTFLQSFVENPIRFEQATGIYTDSYYIDTRTIQTTSFTAHSNGDDTAHPLSNIFAKNNDYWTSSSENSDNFHSTLTFDFPNAVSLEAFLISTTSNNGYPLRLNVYSSLNGEQLTLNAEFAAIPTDSWGSIQFVLPESIKCNKLQLEFVQVTNKKATITQLTLLKSLDYDYISYSAATGFLSDSHYVETHRIPFTNMEISSTGEKSSDNDEFKIQNVLDDNDGTIWISSFENTDDKHAKIFINFTKPINLEAIVMNARYYKKSLTSKYIVGFPQKMKINASLDDDYYSVLYTGSPQTSNTKYQFILPKITSCSKLEFDLSDLTDEKEFSGGKKVAIITGISIIGEEVEDFSSSNYTDDLQSIHVNKSFIGDEVIDTTFSNISLPKDDKYLFIVEKTFHFANVLFSCIQNKMSAIKTTEAPQVLIEKCQFVSCVVRNEQDFGGAINFINAGMNCGKSDFFNCQSSRGGGIYIRLDKPVKEKVKIDGCKFNKCSAENGGGCYIYSNLMENTISLSNCEFVQNLVKSTQDSSTDSDYGAGSGIFMRTMKGSVRRCKFIDNEGSSSCTILNDFTKAEPSNKLSGRLARLLKDNDDSVLISDCVFEINQKSKSSLFYVGGKYGSRAELRNSVFSGKLQNGAHHIDGKSNTIDAHKLLVRTCRFSHNAHNSLNYDPNNSYLSIDLKSQEFDFRDSFEKKQSNNSSKIIVSIVAPIVAVSITAVIIVVVVKSKKKSQDDQVDENEMTVEKHQLLEQSLL